MRKYGIYIKMAQSKLARVLNINSLSLFKVTAWSFLKLWLLFWNLNHSKVLIFFFWGLSKFFRTIISVKKYFPSFSRHYHGHLSAVYDLALHPTIDVLVSCGRDSTARVWDMRTKTNIHTLSGHTSTVGTVVCQAADPQIITGIEIILFLGRAKIFIKVFISSVNPVSFYWS